MYHCGEYFVFLYKPVYELISNRLCRNCVYIMRIDNTLSDSELIELLRTGNYGAFTEIYNRHWKFLFEAAYNVSRKREDSLDVCQSVFLWVWENRAQLKATTNLKGYLFTAVKFKIANQIRNGKYREGLFEDLEKIDSRVHQVDELEIKELKNFIAQLINELPNKCREVFLLSRTEHLSHKEIAERLGISEKTVDAHILAALKKLRVPLEHLALIFLFLY